MNLQHNGNLSIQSLSKLKSRFSQYVHSFFSSDPIIQQAIELKENHSLRVCSEILNIGKKLDLSDNDLRIAEAMALLHDIGRFEQYTRYRTFLDNKSENHGELGVNVLRQQQTLADLDETTRNLILKAVSCHNRFSIPEDESFACVFFSKLLRDADKLDIMNLHATYYHVNPAERIAAVELDLPDINTPEVPEDILDSLQEGRMVRIQQLKSVNDYKIFQMSFIYDINFQPTFQTILDRNYLKLIRDTMPASESIDHVYSLLMSYLKKGSNSNTP
jgi:putative nucleotidyltransferase with HDIG domain